MVTARGAPHPSSWLDARTGRITLSLAAVIAGSGLLLLTAIAIAAFASLQGFVVEGDATRTAANVAQHESRFYAMAFGFLVVAALDVVVGWALYELLRPVNRRIALLMAWLRVVYGALFAAGINLFTAGIDAQVLASMDAFSRAWNIALLILALHLIVLGFLVYRSGYVPRTIGILLWIAAIGYAIDGIGELVSKSYEANVAGYTFVGEVVLMGWLLWKGRALQGAEPSISAHTRIT